MRRFEKNVILNPFLNFRPENQCYTMLGFAQNGAKDQFKTIFYITAGKLLTICHCVSCRVAKRNAVK
ncbi:hypothetical protein E5S67_00224 [Microcoleus sp. IPMA8]|uniref:Uncharacterized protein n=1 Tax=Microcoleus asticus IPMA8 TaxID=2563858 RepID=A0ABX2CQ62_9CYAN|nr:hypothetical protein [Microcoleus asticus IPMA8]